MVVTKDGARANDSCMDSIINSIEEQNVSQLQGKIVIEEVRLLRGNWELWILESNQEGVAFFVNIWKQGNHLFSFSTEGPIIYSK